MGVLGAMVLFFLLVTGSAAMIIVYWAIKTKRVVWTTIKATEAAKDV